MTELITNHMASTAGLILLGLAGAFAVGCLASELTSRILDRFWP